MIHFNEDERLNPTIVRRRIAQVQKALSEKTTSHAVSQLCVEEAEVALNQAKANSSMSYRAMVSLSDQKNKLTTTLELLKKKANRQVVTDHAVVQFIDRVLGIDVQEIRNKIIGKDAKKIRNMEEDGSIDRDNYTLVVSGGVIATILSEGMKDLNPVVS